MMASVKVAVRVRPLNKREETLKTSVIVSMEGKTTHITNVKLPSSGNDTLGRERVKQFTYDYSYWSLNPSDAHFVSQEEVFEDLGEDVIEAAYQGYNTCVLAYGQTGSGKTYTMMGDEGNPGLIPRISERLFTEMKDASTTYRAEVSYLEIYNERVRDLLRDKNQPQANLKVREHPKEGPYVQDLSKHLAVNYTDVLALIERGNEHRTTASTNMNIHSSRSHAIFTIMFTQAKFCDDVPSEINSKVHLVDLAGSERADSSGATGDRLKEGGSINKSLVTLGNVISTLADVSDKMAGVKKNVFIPYRDSVLTWLLKDSLGGNAKTIMIATVSPADCNYAETLSTLRYASRAKKIVNKPMVNEDPNVKLIRELREENARLRALLGQTAMQDVLPTMQEFAATREKLNRNEEKVRVLTEKWTDKWQETANVLEEHKSLGLRKEGTGVVLDSELPYILAMDDNILSTGMKLYHIKEGQTLIGREDAGETQDIILTGKLIEAEHCIIHHKEGEVTLVPLEGALCSINNLRVHEPTKLSQGSIIRLGRGHLFRYNHPGEAAKLREEMKGQLGSQQLIQVWQDFQWTWSSLSIADSAVGSASEDMTDCSQAVSDTDFDGNLHSCSPDLSIVTDNPSSSQSGEAGITVILNEPQGTSQNLLCFGNTDFEKAHSCAQGDLKDSLDFDQKSCFPDDDDEEDDDDEDTRVDSPCHHQEELRLLDKKREELVKLEEDHVLAEARRLSSQVAAEAGASGGDLSRTSSAVEIQTQTLIEAERQIREIASDLEQRAVAHSEQERHLQQEGSRLQKLKDKLERDKARARAERQKLRKQRELERARRSLERERQEIEWAEIEQQRQELEKQLQEHRQKISNDKGDQEKARTVEQDIYQTEMSRMRDLLDTEVREMRMMAGLPADPSETTDVKDNPRASLERLTLRLSPVPDSIPLPLCNEVTCPEGNQVRRKLDYSSDSKTRSLGELDEGSVETELQEVGDMVCGLHSQVCRTLRQKYSSVLSSDDHTVGLAVHVLAEFAEIRPRFSRLEQFVQKNPSHRDLLHKLSTLDRLLHISDRFVQVHELLQTIEKGTKKLNFLSTIDQLEDVNNVLSRLELEEEAERKLHKMMQTEVCIQREKLLYQLGETWTRLICWNPAIEGSRKMSTNSLSSFSLEIAQGEGDHDMLVCLAQAMLSVGMLDSRIRSLCDRIITGIVTPIVQNPTAVVNIVDETDSYQLKLTVTPFSKPEPAKPAEAFEKLLQVFFFLHRAFCNLSVKEVSKTPDSIGIKKISNLVEKIGQAIHKKLFECIYTECLSQTLPKTGAHQWKEFNSIILKIEEFEETLEDLEFLEPHHDSLLDYLSNVSHLFANMKSQDLMRRAHEMMTGDLGSGVPVSSDHPLGLTDALDSVAKEQYVLQCREQVSTTKYRLPTCRVSLAIQNLMALAYDTVQEAQAGSHEGAFQLQTSVRSVFELYCDTMSSHHGDRLVNLPLFAALHHNNSMFVAHHLITLDRLFQQRLFPNRTFVHGRSPTPGGWTQPAASPKTPSTPVSPMTSPFPSNYLSPLRSTVTPGRTLIPTKPHPPGCRPLTRGRSLTPCGSPLPSPSPCRDNISPRNSGITDAMSDLIQRVRKQGNDVFTQHITLKSGQLCDLLTRAQGFSCVADDEGVEASGALKQVVRHLGRVADTWRGVLPSNVYCRGIGSLLNAAVKDVLQSVLHIEEFSVEDCECLQEMLKMFMLSSVHLFKMDDSSASSSNPQVTVHEFVPCWLKLKELIELLGSGLQVVSDRWADGKGPLALHFTTDEVSHVVRAMFENTRKRERLLASLKLKPSVHGAVEHL